MLIYNHRVLQNLTVANFNADGINRQRSTLIAFLARHKIDIMCISETHLIPEQQFKIAGYQIYRKDRIDENASGGVAVLIKRNISHSLHTMPHLATLEAIAINLIL